MPGGRWAASPGSLQLHFGSHLVQQPRLGSGSGPVPLLGTWHVEAHLQGLRVWPWGKRPLRMWLVGHLWRDTESSPVAVRVEIRSQGWEPGHGAHSDSRSRGRCPRALEAEDRHVALKAERDRDRVTDAMRGSAVLVAEFISCKPSTSASPGRRGSSVLTTSSQPLGTQMEGALPPSRGRGCPAPCLPPSPFENTRDAAPAPQQPLVLLQRSVQAPVLPALTAAAPLGPRCSVPTLTRARLARVNTEVRPALPLPQHGLHLLVTPCSPHALVTLASRGHPWVCNSPQAGPGPGALSSTFCL